MAVVRYLGAGWASVHGPHDERKLAVWTLEQGFAGLCVGASPRPIDWPGLVRQITDLPFAVPALRCSGGNAGMGSSDSGDRAAAITAIRAAGDRAVGLGVATLVFEPGAVPVPGGVEQDGFTDESADWTEDAAKALFARRGPGRDAALDRVCRGLFELGRLIPDLNLALAPSRSVTGLGDPDSLAAIFEDLPGRRIGYWHDPSVSAVRNRWLGEDQGVWLERFADLMVGTDLADGADASIQLLPGAGLVDYGMLASYIRRSEPLPGVLELNPGVDPGELAGARSFLSKFGL